MDRGHPGDPLLFEIRALLEQLARRDSGIGVARPAGDSPWLGDYSPQDDRWPLSATELLVSWSPAGAGPEVDWDRYLAPSDGPVASGHVRGSSAPEPIVVPEFDLLGTDYSDDAGQADPVAAAAAVDQLFAIVHALERRDFEALMASVADDFHAMDGDDEVDRRSLRQRLEAYADERREGLWRVSVSDVPHPVFHPVGILIPTILAVDFVRADGSKHTDLVSRLTVFGETEPGVWKLCGMTELD